MRVLRPAAEVAAEMVPNADECRRGPHIRDGDDDISLDSWDDSDLARVWLTRFIGRERAAAYAAGKADGVREERERERGEGEAYWKEPY